MNEPGSNQLLIVERLRGLRGLDPVAPDRAFVPPRWTEALVLDRLSQWSHDFVHTQSSATSRAVRADWAQYVDWCKSAQRSPLPASVDQLTAFLTSSIERGRKLTTVRRYLYTINLVHDAATLPNPATQRKWKLKWNALLEGLRDRAEKSKDSRMQRQLTSKQAGQLLRKDVDQIIDSLGDTPVELRDGAMVLLASDALLRESELVRVQVEDFGQDRDTGTWNLHVRPSKANDDGKPIYRYVSQETITHIRAWTRAIGITSGYLFLGFRGRPRQRSTQWASVHRASPRPDSLPTRKPLRPSQVARIFRRRALAAGLPHALTISGNSARSGMANELINAGSSTLQIQEAGGWNSADMISRYARSPKAEQD